MKNTSTPTTTSYHFDFATVLLIVSSIYTIPAIYCAFKIVRFYFKSFVPTSTSLNPNLFKAYLRMQNWSLAYVIIDIVLIRVPATSLVATSLCTPWLVPFLVAVQYFTWHTAHLFPVLFCFVRVLILWSPKEHRELYKICFVCFVFFTPAVYILSSVIAFPNTISRGVCVELEHPYQLGAHIISTEYVNKKKSLKIQHFVFTTATLLSITILSGIMVWKLRKRTSSSTSTTRQRSFYRSPADKTLTFTVFLILVPSFLQQVLLVLPLSGSSYRFYLLPVYQLLADFRSNFIPCYFYFSHPVFWKKPTTVLTIKRVQQR